MVEAFWGRLQGRLLNRQTWKTRIELATAIHDDIELFHNSRRRHSALGMLPRPNTKTSTPQAPPDSRTKTPRKPGQIKVSTEPGELHCPGEARRAKK
jgi:transposase InsO family protein